MRTGTGSASVRWPRRSKSIVTTGIFAAAASASFSGLSLSASPFFAGDFAPSFAAGGSFFSATFGAPSSSLSGSERRGLLAVQDGDVDGARDRMVDARHVEPGRRRTPVGRSGEVEVLAAAIEDRKARVREPVGRLGRDARVERVNEDRVQVRGELPCVSEIAAVGRPGRLERAIRRFVEIARHLGETAARDVDDPQRQALVVERDLLAVRRPERLVEERRRGAESDAAGFAGAVLGRQVQRVLAGGVGQPIRQPGDGLAVRGPGRVAVGRRRGVGQVADVALLRRHGEDVARAAKTARLPPGEMPAAVISFATSAQRGRTPGRSPSTSDVEPLHRALRDVVETDLAEALDRDRARSGGGRLQVEPVVRRRRASPCGRRCHSDRAPPRRRGRRGRRPRPRPTSASRRSSCRAGSSPPRASRGRRARSASSGRHGSASRPAATARAVRRRGACRRAKARPSRPKAAAGAPASRR